MVYSLVLPPCLQFLISRAKNTPLFSALELSHSLVGPSLGATWPRGVEIGLGWGHLPTPSSSLPLVSLPSGLSAMFTFVHHLLACLSFFSLSLPGCCLPARPWSPSFNLLLSFSRAWYLPPYSLSLPKGFGSSLPSPSPEHPERKRGRASKRAPGAVRQKGGSAHTWS